MQFLYHKNSGDDILSLNKNDFNHIFKVRRSRNTKLLNFRNMQDDNLYTYELIEKTTKEAKYKLNKSKKQIQKKTGIHLAISIIDPKEIEKTLPILNELEVKEISFIYTKNSQKNFKINMERLNKILINSSQQCGRGNFIKINNFDNIKDFLKIYPDSHILHFNKNNILNDKMNIKSIVIGAEGGFSDEEIELFDDDKKVGLNTSSILKSSTACIFLSSVLA